MQTQEESCSQCSRSPSSTVPTPRSGTTRGRASCTTRFTNSSAVRRSGLDILQKNRAQKWLSDDRFNAVLRPEDVDWSHQFWFPQTVQAGWKYWAIVQPDKVVGQVTMKGLASEYGRQGVTSKTFTDPDSALRWLDTL